MAVYIGRVKPSVGAANEFVSGIGSDGGLQYTSLAHLAAHTGAVARSILQVLADVVHVFDYMSIAQIADVIARTALVDVTTALQNAINAGSRIFLPAGVYRISAPLDYTGKILEGEGIWFTQVVSFSNTVTDSVVRLGGSAQLRDLTISYDSSKLTGSETFGQRIGVSTYSVDSGLQLQRGGGIYNVKIESVGTGVWEPTTSSLTSTFSVTFDTIEIQNFSYRGWDFRNTTRTGNVYRNIYINNVGTSFTNADIPFALEGEESEVTISQLNIEWGTYNTALSLIGVRALSDASIHIEQVTLRNPYSPLIWLDKSAGRIAALSVYYCPIINAGWFIIQIGDSTYDGATYNPTTLRKLSIGTLHLKGLNDGSQVSSGWGLTGKTDVWFIDRETSAVGPFAIEIDRYVWNTFQTDQAVYQSFPNDPHARLWIKNDFTTIPTITGSTYYLWATDSLVIFNRAGGVTVTLPSAADHPNRKILLRNIAAGAVISASTNIRPITGAALSNALLAATAGKWIVLQSVEGEWTIVQTG